ncbi:hypothetical protein GGQ13_000314 [Salinibacter ruber]|nr:hypothetical protein [Salinibacter ruber]
MMQTNVQIVVRCRESKWNRATYTPHSGADRRHLGASNGREKGVDVNIRVQGVAMFDTSPPLCSEMRGLFTGRLNDEARGQ